MRKGVVEVGKTGWAYILDRETGKPLIGIEEKAVAQEPRQATAATQPFPRGDAVVPQLIGIAPEGHVLVNDCRIFTPFVGLEATIVAPGIWGGASWPTNTVPSPSPTPRAIQPQHTFTRAGSRFASYFHSVLPVSTSIANASFAPVT